jgi:hypothetical protein
MTAFRFDVNPSSYLLWVNINTKVQFVSGKMPIFQTALDWGAFTVSLLT